MKFLLLVLLAGAESAQPVHFEPFDSLKACEAKRLEILKVIPRRADINFVAICAPVRNATQVDV